MAWDWNLILGLTLQQFGYWWGIIPATILGIIVGADRKSTV